MNFKHKEIIINKLGTNESANIFYNKDDICSLKIIFKDGTEYEVKGSDLFLCFCKIRETYKNIIFFCKGAKRNIYPSSMSRDMSGGILAYELHNGKHARKEDLVSIFDHETVDIVSPEEQKNHYLQWAKSNRS